jgi:hypothetical protein
MKQQTKLFKDFLKKIGMGKIKVRNAYEMESDMFKNIIFFSMKWYKEKELLPYTKAIAKLYKQKKYDIKISLATFGFFHELGHILSKVEIKDLNKSMIAYGNQIEKLPKKNLEKRMLKYRALRLEKLADKWGYLIYKTFEKQAIKLDNKLLAIANKSD